MKRIIQILQLDHKWVRVMLIVSTLVILGIVFLPNIKSKVEYAAPAADTVMVDDGRRYFDVGDSVREVYKQFEPLQIPVTKEKEPFDWKGTISWAIGIMNTFVLVILNIKNLILKKRP